ncbi:hypothetical protein N172_22300 [Pantoea dispersa EGD-AAK13]|nr:hypothetical protein N172_22300 [Pantoea dispersa EGD-AAK13]
MSKWEGTVFSGAGKVADMIKNVIAIRQRPGKLQTFLIAWINF